MNDFELDGKDYTNNMIVGEMSMVNNNLLNQFS